MTLIEKERRGGALKGEHESNCDGDAVAAVYRRKQRFRSASL